MVRIAVIGAIAREALARMHDLAAAVEAPMQEYRGIYRRFAEMLRTGLNEMDFSPFRLVGDAFLAGSRRTVAPFPR